MSHVFFLETRPAKIRVMTIVVDNSPECEANIGGHMAEIPVGPEVKLEDARSYLPVKCKFCGKFDLTELNMQCWISSYDTLYVNPRTKESSPRLRKVATTGAMWYAHWLVDGNECSSLLSPEYKRDWFGKRPPIYLRLPNGSDWLIDGRAFDDSGKMGEHGWTITGPDPLHYTAHPSIWVRGVGGYHGWLENGMLRPC